MAISLLCLATSPSPAAPPAPAAKSFFEPFDGLDARRWYVSDGWVNGAHQGCTWSRAAVQASHGVLRMTVERRANRLRPLVCAEIQAQGGRYGYGTYEARMRIARGSGLNTAMFTYSGPPVTPVHDEIDFEFLGKDVRRVQLNYYTGARGNHEAFRSVPADAASAFHDYAFVWEAGRISWYIDGTLVRRAEGPAATLPQTAGKFYLSLWAGSATVNDWLGPVALDMIPATAEVDWAAYTAPGDRCRFPQSITCRLP
ncbi:MAG: family 16 glycosylhydrolase [Novosphingobium sp.]